MIRTKNRIKIAVVFIIAIATNKVAFASDDILTIGDSLTAGLAGFSNGVITCAALGGAVIQADMQLSCKGNGQRNVGGWQPGLSLLSKVNVYNYGNSGELTSQMRARLQSHMGARPSKFVLILGGTNDAIRGPSVSAIISNLQAMVQQVRDNGRIPIIGTLPPLLQGPFRNNNNKVLAINAEIRKFADIEIADHYPALVANWAQNTSGDFIHLGQQGNSLVASVWFDAIKRSLAPASGTIITPINSLILSAGE